MTSLVKVQKDQVVTSSRTVADVFGKRHDHVLRDLDELKEGVTQNWGDLFYETEYTHEQNKQDYREILMNRDGFTLLAMGFTGKKALEWKLKYINAFNEMEESLKQIPNVSQTELIAMMAQNNVEIEKKANLALEKSEKNEKRLDDTLNIFTAPPDKEWRDSMNSKMRGMCEKYELNYPVFYGDLYEELERVARVDLKIRQSKLRKRMLANGATKTACRNITKLEIVERDPKLRPIFEGIVRKYQAKYALTENEPWTSF